jgi:hypothetical protein
MVINSQPLQSDITYLHVSRPQNAADWVSGVCDTAVSTNCALFNGISAPVFPGTATMWVHEQTGLNGLSANWATGVFVQAAAGSAADAKFSLVGKLTITGDAATDFSKVRAGACACACACATSFLLSPSAGFVA